MNGTNMKRIIEALLIATDIPLSLKRTTEITSLPEEEIRKYIDELNKEYHVSGRSFEIKEIAGGFQIYTLPEFALWVGALHDRKSKLSKAALETVAIVAYHQPITRPEIEKLRGVDSSWVLDTLLQKSLIKTAGRLPVPGRPIRYATTKEFLRYFGIKDLSDLPREEDFGAHAAGAVLEEQKDESEKKESGEARQYDREEDALTETQEKDEVEDDTPNEQI